MNRIIWGRLLSVLVQFCVFSVLITALRLFKAASLSSWIRRAPQQGGFQLSREIESRSSGWRTVTPNTTPPCWPGQQQYMVQCGTGTIRSRNEMFKWRFFFFLSWNVWKKYAATALGSFLGSSRQSSLAGLPITKKKKRMLENSCLILGSMKALI